MLELQGIHKNYRMGPVEVQVLKGLNLRIARGSLVAVMGASGGGKSTLMNILGLLDKPSAGTYEIDGERIAYDDDDALSHIRNHKIGFVFQAYHLLARLSAAENVGLPLVYRGMKRGRIDERVRHYLEKVNMDQRAGHKPFELSGGQQQRVAIARAMVGQPALILADEPTGALDPAVGEEIMDLFVRLNAEEGITVIVITHDPKVGQRCQRRLMLQDGAIVEE